MLTILLIRVLLLAHQSRTITPLITPLNVFIIAQVHPQCMLIIRPEVASTFVLEVSLILMLMIQHTDAFKLVLGLLTIKIALTNV